jgi:hypothetical protein
MINGYPALLHEFFHLPVAQGIGQIPPHARQDNVSHKVGPFEANDDRSLARGISCRISGTDHSRNYEQRKFATEPVNLTTPFNLFLDSYPVQEHNPTDIMRGVHTIV